ncbi:MAG: GAF domain-containing sensor histidine kinase [Mucispirillum sp.]|nr:GAF domain-containing sensor histidine kinase [Mucispirillum sp.]
MKGPLLNALTRISAEINSTKKLDVLLPDIVKITGDYLKVRNASIVLIDWDTLTINCYTGCSSYHNSLSVKQGVIGDVAESGTEYIVNKKSYSSSGKSFLALPLKIGSKILGVFYLTDKDENYFNYEDVLIARYIAFQCALAIEMHNIHNKMRANENLQAIGLLKSSVAHDISNLVAIVDVYLGLMEEEVDKSAAIYEYVNAVKSEVKRISILATDMLDLSKNKLVIHKTKFKISELVNELKLYSEAFSKTSNAKVEFHIKCDDEIVADRNRLFRVFFNLLNNAGNAVKENGIIIFSVKKTGKYITFLVADNGKGIRKEDIGKLFQPFYTSGKIKGTGLGLAVVHDIIEAHNGSIRVRSTLGSYTCFFIRIPQDG